MADYNSTQADDTQAPAYSGPTWMQVTSSPSWKQFSPDQRASIRQHFYDTYVSPTAADDDARVALRKQFDQLTAPSMQIDDGRQSGGAMQSILGFLGNQVAGAERGTLRAGRGLAIAAGGVNQILPDAAVPWTQDQAFDVASKLKGYEDKLPQAKSTIDRIAQATGALPIGFATAGVGSPGAGGQDVIDRGGSLGQAEAAVGIDAGANLLGLRLGGLGMGGTLARRLTAQGVVGAGLYEGSRRANNAILPDQLREDFDPVSAGLSVGSAMVPAALSHGSALDGSHDATPGGVVDSSESRARQTSTSNDTRGAVLLDDAGRSVGAQVDARNARDVLTTLPLADDASVQGPLPSVLDSLPPLSPADRAQRSQAARAQVLDEFSRIHNLDDDQRAMLDSSAPGIDDVQPDGKTGAYPASHLPDTLEAAVAHAGATGEPLHIATVSVPAATPKAVRKIVDTMTDALGDNADEIVPHYGDNKVSFVIRGADSDAVQSALDTARELGRRASGRKITTALEPVEGTPPGDAARARAGVSASVDEAGALDPNTQRNTRAGDVPARDASSAPTDRVPADDTQTATPDRIEAAAAVPRVDDLINAADTAIANRRADGLLHDWLLETSPMAAGTPESRAIAKDYANSVRLARHEGNQADTLLMKNFTPEQHTKMWRAADEESVLRQRGEDTTGRGLDRLDPKERAAVEALQGEANKAFEEAKAIGIISPDAKPLPSYVPRMLVSMDNGIAKFFRGKSGADTTASGKIRTNSPNAKGRKYLTADETQAAAQGHDDNAQLVENIRALPLAIARLRQAIAGRQLVNQIREIGRKHGQQTVVEGRNPSKADERYFTMPDEPALSTYRTRVDEHGNTVNERVPLYIRRDFEGPLRAVLGDKRGAIYNGLMQLKQKTMGLVIYSPITHNMVEFGRALPAMPGKVASFKVYFEGNAAKNDPATMREAIQAGLSPISHGGHTDITGIASEPSLSPGRSWTAKLLAAVPGMFDPKAGTAVKRWVDKAGDVWHNTLLWDRIADLQMGLYVNFRDSLIKKGLDPRAAQISAAHLANRYAGALPKEAMSEAARKIANLVLFSRTFTLGNLGALKDTLTGLPKDAQAQILRDCGQAQLSHAINITRKKAIATVMVDIGLGMAMNSVLQSSIAILAGDSSLDKEQRGYAQRLNQALQMVKENPLDMLKALEHVSATSTNEPGKHDRVLVGHTADGTAIYLRNPVGKIGEEFTGWMTKPLDTLKAKLSTFAKPIYQTVANDVGFGHKLYDDKDQLPGATMRAVGRIVANFIGQQLPLSAIQGAKDWYAGNGDATLNASKVLAPLAGMTFSKGAPGGEAVGEMYAARARHDFNVQDAMPGIREQIRRGDVRGAYQHMLQLGMQPGLAQWEIRATLQPSTRLSQTQLQNFARYATAEERQRMAAALQRQRGVQ